MRLRLISALAGAVALAGCNLQPPASSGVHVVIVGTTDHHGWIDGHRDANALPYGGLALLAGYLDALRAANDGRVVLVDSGDMFQGTLESNLFEGESVIAGYNRLGYAAAAIGNHEFDYGPVGPVSVVPAGSGLDPVGALKARAAQAQFPLLAANLTEAATGTTPPWARRSIVVERGGAKIGIVGLSLPETPVMTQPANVALLRFGDPIAATIAEARDLRAAGADAVIVIAHIGGRCTDLSHPDDLSSCDAGQDVMKFANGLPHGTVDAIFAGHTHQRMRQVVNGIPVLEAAAFGREFAALDLWIDPAAHKVTRTALRQPTMLCAAVYAGTESCDPHDQAAGVPTPRRFEGRIIAPDPGMQALLQPYLDKVAVKQAEKIGVTTTAPFTTDYRRESPLGDLLTDALRDAYRADVAFLNAGGLRSRLPAGALTYGDVFRVAPFDNYPAVLRLTGAEITAVIHNANRKGVLQVSGLRYTIDAGGNERVVLADGRKLDPARLYKVATIDFLVAGGDGFAEVMRTVPRERIDLRLGDGPIRDVLIAALAKRTQPLTPKTDGRITTPAQAEDISAQ